MARFDFGAGNARSRWLGAVPVAVAALGAALIVPREAPPDGVPLPVVDIAQLGARVREDVSLAQRARAESLPGDVREFGTLLRDWNRLEATSDDATRIGSARGALDKALPPLLAKSDSLRALRAVQLEAFLHEVRSFERTGQVSEELVALGGPFIDRMRAVGWVRGRRVLLSEDERRVAYKQTWNGIAGVDRRPEFSVSLDETRVLYGLYLRLPHAPEAQLRGFDAARRGAKDAAACDALAAGERLAAEAWRLERIGRLAALDPSYPAAYAKGIANFRMRKFIAAGDQFALFLRDHPDGTYSLKAKNFLRAAHAAARSEAL